MFKTSMPTKKVILNFVVRCPFPQNRHVLPKWGFHGFLTKYCFFEKIVKRKILKTSMPMKKVILIFVARRPVPSKQSHPPTNRFFAVFSENTAFFRKTCSMIEHPLPNL